MSSAKVKARETLDPKDKSSDNPICQKSKQKQRQECPGDTWDKPSGKVHDKDHDAMSSQKPDIQTNSLRGDVRMERQLRSADRQSLRRAAAAGAAAIVHAATTTSSPSAAREWPVSSERSECSASVSASPATDSVPSSPQHRSEYETSRHNMDDAHPVGETVDHNAADQLPPSTPPNAVRHLPLKRKRTMSIGSHNVEEDADDEDDELCDSDLRHPNEEGIDDEGSIDITEKDELIETCPRSPSVHSDASSTSLSSFSPSSSNMVANYRSSGHANRATGNYSEDGSATTLMGSATSLEDHLPLVSPREGKFHNLKHRDEGQGMVEEGGMHDKRQSNAAHHREDDSTVHLTNGRHEEDRVTAVATRSQSAVSPVIRQSANGQIHEPPLKESTARYTVTMLSGAPQRKSCDRCFRMKTKCSRAGPGAPNDGPCEGCVRRGFGHDCVTSRPDFPHPRITLAKRPRRELGATIVSGSADKTLIHASPSSRARAVQWSRQHSAYAASNHESTVRRHDESCLSSTASVAVSPSLMITSKSAGSNRQAMAYENSREARTTYLDTYGRHEHLNSENPSQSQHDSQHHLRYSSTRNRRSPSVDAIDRPRRELMAPNRLSIATNPRSMHSHSSASYHPCEQTYGGSRSASTAIEKQQQKYNGARSSIYGNASKSSHSYQGCDQGDDDLCRNVSVLHRSLHESNGDGDGSRSALASHLRSMHTTELRDLGIFITYELVRRTSMPSPPPPIRTSSASTVRYSEHA